jgi:2-polyprenyl-6-methoxyphenol hydroxylase-like FAD-dependent oxidoreductase
VRGIKVVIAGGGLGGVALGRALRHRGIDFELYERATAFRPAGAAVAIQPNAIKALRKIDPELADAAIAAGEEQDTSRDGTVILNPRGKVLARLALGDLRGRYGAPTVTIRRTDFHDVLRHGLPDSALRVDHEVASFEDHDRGVAVKLANGRQIEGDLLVGADGIHSTVREQLWGKDDLLYRGYTSWRALPPRPDHALCARGRTFNTFGPGGFFGGRSLGDQLYWHAEFFAARGEVPAMTPEAARERLMSHVRGWHAPIEDLVRASDAIVCTDIHDREPLAKWSKGCVTLLGDAAHPTSAHLGQGCGMAMEDVACLADAISANDDAASAFAHYEAKRLERTKRITLQSRQQGRTQVTSSWFTGLRRDLLMRVFDKLQNPDREVPQLRELYRYEP